MRSPSVSKDEVTLAVGSAISTAVCVSVFGVAVFVPALEMICYAASFGIAICYLMLTVANEPFSTCRSYARLSTVFAVVYCTMVCIVYYTQLTYVRLGSPNAEALSVVSYQHTGSVFFAIDLCGYFFMSMSVLCLGFSMEGLLRKLLVAMGVWGATCIAVPLFPFFYNQDDSSSSDQFGVAALSMWAILFLPLMVVLAQHYHHLAGRTS